MKGDPSEESTNQILTPTKREVTRHPEKKKGPLLIDFRIQILKILTLKLLMGMNKESMGNYY